MCDFSSNMNTIVLSRSKIKGLIKQINDTTSKFYKDVENDGGWEDVELEVENTYWLDIGVRYCLEELLNIADGNKDYECLESDLEYN